MKMINALYGQEAAVRANAEALDRAAEKGAEYTTEMAKAADSNWDATMCSIPDDHIAPRRSALFMARSVLSGVRAGRGTC